MGYYWGLCRRRRKGRGMIDKILFLTSLLGMARCTACDEILAS